jgi:AraC family transcriptional regulator
LKVSDPGILDKSIVFAFTPSENTSRLLFYATWCGHYYCTSRYIMERDTYPYLLVMYIQKGKMYLRYRGEEKTAQEGDVVLLDCRESHCYRAEDGLEFYYLHYDGSNSHELTQFIIQRNGWLIKKKDNRLVKEKIGRLLDGYGSGRTDPPMTISLRIYEILEVLMASESADNSMTALIGRSITYIREHVGDNISLSDLAEEVNLSVYYYSHCFKAVTGVSPMDYVINTRIERAKVLLIRTDLPVSEIAYRVGYASSGSLINLFNKHEGMSPNKFRKTYFNR